MVTEAIADYRAQTRAEDASRQLKDTGVASFSPMHHRTDDHIRVHTSTCVLASAEPIRNDTRSPARRPEALHPQGPGGTPAPRKPSCLPRQPKGRPHTQRLLTDHSSTVAKLAERFSLDTYAHTR